MGSVSDERTTAKGSMLIILWLTLAALKADGIIDWLWVVIIAGPVVVYWTVSVVTSLLAFAAARRLMKRF